MNKTPVSRGGRQIASEAVFQAEQWQFDGAIDYPYVNDSQIERDRQTKMQSALLFSAQEDVKNLVNLATSRVYPYTYRRIAAGQQLPVARYDKQEVLRVMHVRQTNAPFSNSDLQRAKQIDANLMDSRVADMSERDNNFYDGSHAIYVDANKETGRTRTYEVSIYFCLGMQDVKDTLLGVLSSEFSDKKENVERTNHKAITLDSRMKVGKRYMSEYPYPIIGKEIIKPTDADYNPNGPKKQERLLHDGITTVEFIAAAGIIRGEIMMEDLPQSPMPKLAKLHKQMLG